MQHPGSGAALLVGLSLSACVVVSPLIDRRMADAPNSACAAVNGQIMAEAGTSPGNLMGPGSGQAVEPRFPAQCFALSIMDAEGQSSAWGGELLEPGQTLVAVHQPGPDCSGTFTHLTIEGAAQAPGRMQLATWDVHGRPGHQRTVRWREGFAGRTFALADIGSTNMNPAGARISVLEGVFDPQHICFKSY